MRDDNGLLFPSMMPLSVSFEFWAQWNQLNYWSRIFDCGNGPFGDNILLSNVANSNDFRAAFFRENVTVNNALAPRSIYPNTWQHIVVSIAQRFLNDSNSATAASISIYIDGVLVNKNPEAYLLRSVIARIAGWARANGLTTSSSRAGSTISSTMIIRFRASKLPCIMCCRDRPFMSSLSRPIRASSRRRTRLRVATLIVGHVSPLATTRRWRNITMDIWICLAIRSSI